MSSSLGKTAVSKIISLMSQRPSSLKVSYNVSNGSDYCLSRKGRRKDKDSPTPPGPEETKEYLQEDFVRTRITDADLTKLVTLPPYIDSDEWLATHSEYG